MEGFIQLHRKMLEWEWYDDINTKVLFMHLLLKANWKDKKWRGIDIYRGEYITSLGKLSEETGLSLQQVRTSIKKLKSTQEVTHKGQGSFSIIKVLKYDEYQSSNTQDNKPVTNNKQSSNKVVTTTNKDNKDNKEKNIINSISEDKSSPQIEEIIEDEIIEEKSSEISIINEKGNIFKTIDNEKVLQKYEITENELEIEIENFINYWTAPVTKGKKADIGKPLWETKETFAANLRFSTWLSNNKKWQKRNLSSKPKGIGVIQ